MLRRLLFLGFGMLLIVQVLHAQSPVLSLSQKQTGALTALGMHLDLWQDTSNQWTIARLSQEGQGLFAPYGEQDIKISKTLTNHWYRLRIRPGSLKTGWMLSLSYPVIDQIRFYSKDQYGNWQYAVSGDMVAYRSRTKPDRQHLFEVPLHGDSVQTFYLCIYSEGSINSKVLLSQENSYYHWRIIGELAYGFFFGTLAMIIVLNIILFGLFRHYSYLIYVVYMSCTMLFQTVLSGHFYQIFFTDVSGWQNPLLTTAVFTSLFFGYWFAGSFLQFKVFAPGWQRVIYVAMAILAMVILVNFVLPYHVMIRLLRPLSTVAVVLMVVLGSVSWAKGNREARFYVAGYAGYMVFALCFMLSTLGHLPVAWYTTHGVEIGISIEAIALSLALAERSLAARRKIRTEREEAQATALRMEKHATELLEAKVHQRTQELMETVGLVQQQKAELERRQEAIELQTKDITDSINYASRIQHTILPSADAIRHALGEHFIFFKPRDIVSGDFYFYTEKSGKHFLAVVDCTGHGVPGAFMSMIAHDTLHRLIVMMGLSTPDQILNQLHREIRTKLRQDVSDSRDGMDLGLCVFQLVPEEYRELVGGSTLSFAGSRHNLYYIWANQKDRLEEIKGDRFPIGGYQWEEERVFTCHTLTLDAPMTLYMCSDGYADQFGGPEKRKFSKTRWRETLLDIQQYPVVEQGKYLENILAAWMKASDQQQMDDILVMGLELK